MAQTSVGEGMQEAWDRASADYLARRGSDVASVSYGNLAPSEDELLLLGELHALRVLDVGCGGGHNAVACALGGAEVVGVDVSAKQLAAAAALARANRVEVEWRQADAEQLRGFAESSFDLVLAIQVLPYVWDAGEVLRRARGLLRPGGQLVVSFDHPLRNCFFDEEMQELGPYPLRPYRESALVHWNFAPDVPMRSWHRPLGECVDLMVGAGLVVQRIVECDAPIEVQDALWPEDSPLAPLRNLPHTAIVVGRVAV